VSDVVSVRLGMTANNVAFERLLDHVLNAHARYERSLTSRGSATQPIKFCDCASTVPQPLSARSPSQPAGPITRCITLD
jgi:hypothetical protein